MRRFSIQRKISDTLLGAVYECRFNPPPPPAGAQLLTTSASHRPRSLVALKRSSLTTRKQLAERLTKDGGDAAADRMATLDDPLHERRVAAALIASGGHANVLQCYDHFVTNDDGDNADDVIYIVTEYCNGGDLFSYLAASSTQGINEQESVSLLLQVARGVAFLQSRLGLAHRDLSLENVLLRNGVCKLADFGLATPVGERSRDCVGKRPYMAPEVITASQVEGYDPSAADVWSLGVMLFMLLTGSPLVDEASLEDPRFVAVTRHGVDAILTSWRVDASRGLVDTLASMLQVSPMKRPNIGEIVERLTELEAATAERQSAL